MRKMSLYSGDQIKGREEENGSILQATPCSRGFVFPKANSANKPIVSYAQAFPATRLLVVQAVDPRVAGAATNLKWQYDNTASGIVGYVVREMNGVSGETMMSFGSQNSQTPL